MMSSHKTTTTGFGLAVLSISILLVGLSLATGHFYTKCTSISKEKTDWKHKAILELERRKGTELLLDSAKHLLQSKITNLNECRENYRSLRESVDSLRRQNRGLQHNLRSAERKQAALLNRVTSCATYNATLRRQIVAQPVLLTWANPHPTDKTENNGRPGPAEEGQITSPDLASSTSSGDYETLRILFIGFLITLLISGAAARINRHRYRRRLRKRVLRTPR